MAKSSKKKKKSAADGLRRGEYRYETSAHFMPMWVAIVGFLGATVLGAGVFGVWIMDEPFKWAEYVVAVGGLGLGLSLWFGQAPETAVLIGDSGIAVEDGKQMVRIPWYRMRSLKVSAGSMVAEGETTKLKFLIGANPEAAAQALKEASVRVPDVVDVDKAIAQSLPAAEGPRGKRRSIEDDQVTGVRCASSKKIIRLEEEARLCPTCGQVYHRDALPDRCSHCDAELQGRTLRP